MAYTLSSIDEEISDKVFSNIGQMSASIADAALDGARGNSGAILAQFFVGFAEGIKTKKIHEYLHTSASDMSGFSSGDQIDISGRHIAIDSRILQEDGDEILLEDGTTNSPNSSQIGYILSDEGNIDKNSSRRVQLKIFQILR